MQVEELRANCIPAAPSAQLFLEYYQGEKTAAKRTSGSTVVVAAAGSGAENGDSDTTLHLG